MSKEKLRILIVDDDWEDVNVISEALALHSPGIEIITAENGRMALEYLNTASTSLSLVILDLNMPELDGKNTLAKIQDDEQLSKVPVVILTTSSNQTDRKYFEKLNVKMLTKPWDNDQIKEIVQQLLYMASN